MSMDAGSKPGNTGRFHTHSTEPQSKFAVQRIFPIMAFFHADKTRFA